jgi:hexosaminidase
MRRCIVSVASVVAVTILDACGDASSQAQWTPDAMPGAMESGAASGDASTQPDASGTSKDGGASGEDGGSGVCPPHSGAGGDSGDPSATAAMSNLVPLPISVMPAQGAFLLSTDSAIRVDPATAEMIAVGEYLAAKLRPATGYMLPVTPTSGASGCPGDIVLTTSGDAALGDEGYDLVIDADRVRLAAHQPAGVFRGLQTIRQLLPAVIENSTLQPGPFGIAAGTIHDSPRFAWRGTMLDVARHFFSVQDVETYIDLLAYYKINVLHLHLSDDQGWRIVISSWPNLATYGGSTDYTGGPGGYYTQADYSGIVAYAQSRYMTVIPEIDMPSHTNAARASYGSLNCDGNAPALSAGGGALCINGDDATYMFVSDVVREISAITPGPFFHVGGDESTVSSGDYQTFFSMVQPFVQQAGKRMIGWAAIAQVPNLLPQSVVQYWTSGDDGVIAGAVAQGAKVLMSVASKAYLDMKYDPSTMFGQTWAGYIDEQTGYTWDPAQIVAGVGDAELVGLEPPLWTETLPTLNDVEYMAFPRICGYAEIGWSAADGRSWDEYKGRIGSHGPRLRAMGVNYHSSQLIPWQ